MKWPQVLPLRLIWTYINNCFINGFYFGHKKRPSFAGGPLLFEAISKLIISRHGHDRDHDHRRNHSG